MEISFKGKTVIVTGSSSGIGRATAIMFAASDPRVIVHYRQNKVGAEETLSLLKPGDHFCVSGDLSNPVDLQRFTKPFGKSGTGGHLSKQCSHAH